MCDAGATGCVAVFVEQQCGRLLDVTREVLGKARDLADTQGLSVLALVPGKEVRQTASLLAAHGADRILVAEADELEEYATLPTTRVLTDMIGESRPEIVLFGATPVGRDVAPRVAQRLGTGLTADCTGLTVDPETGLLNQVKPAYGGRAMVLITTAAHRPQMATVRPGAMPGSNPDPTRVAEIEDFPVTFDPADLVVRYRETAGGKTSRTPLEQARVIVAGGRGVGSRQGFEALGELADALGAELGASRTAVENGWIGEEHLVGQTGKTVRPDLYIACGISGALQHRAGIAAAGVVVAINKDPHAQIFSAADYGLVGDVHDIVPFLTRALKER